MKGQSIGDLKFKTIQACYEYAKAIINSEICKVDETHPKFKFIIDLLENHPWKAEKIGDGVKYFIIEPNKINQTGNTIYVIRNDGSSVDFSWRLCCGKDVKKSTFTYNLTNAMRNSIKDYTTLFKRSNTLKCELCSITELEYNKYHVDHKTIPFSIIMERFLKFNNYEHLTFNSCPVVNSSVFKPDEVFQYKWIDYHNQYADYQILCGSCNSKKGNKC